MVTLHTDRLWRDTRRGTAGGCATRCLWVTAGDGLLAASLGKLGADCKARKFSVPRVSEVCATESDPTSGLGRAIIEATTLSNASGSRERIQERLLASWNPEQLEQQVLRSQRERLLIECAHRTH